MEVKCITDWRGLAVSVAGLIIAVSALSASPVSATPVDYGTAFRLQVDAGIENPLIFFGFNPQPEPPPLSYTGTSLSLPGDDAALTAGGLSNPQSFQVFFAISSANGATVVPPADPAADFAEITVPVDTGLQTLMVTLRFSSESGGIGSSLGAVSFNPQPEPPPSVLGDYSGYGLDFSFTSLSDATVVLNVTDDSGQNLPISAVPLAPAAVYLIAAFAGAAGLAARRRALPNARQ